MERLSVKPGLSAQDKARFDALLVDFTKSTNFGFGSRLAPRWRPRANAMGIFVWSGAPS
jgi:hypothetical protein